MRHKGTKTLETSRLLLRRIYKDDALEIYNGFINQEGFLYYLNKEKRTLEEEIASLEMIDEKNKRDDYYNWVITLKDTGKIIGMITLKVEEVNECVEATYVIDDRYCNRGYMSEALERVIKYSFEELLVNRFQTCCVVSNEASRKVMEKCCMGLEGILRSYVILKDGYHDTYMYSIVRKDLVGDNDEAF